ncbi:MAG: type II toxin-antitoxin system RelE/ParE family toxin [Clostridiales bacterium]|nr:type II toxin-antitoxin system RelE/ParE family toxin [Clostridiales bacterium]
MVKYRVTYSVKARRQLGKLDAFQRKIIISWIEKNLIGTSYPRMHGKGLVEGESGLWRYRVGDYRLVAEIRETEIVINIIRVGHRSKVYS